VGVAGAMAGTFADLSSETCGMVAGKYREVKSFTWNGRNWGLNGRFWRANGGRALGAVRVRFNYELVGRLQEG
jgi:hypothetical protein